MSRSLAWMATALILGTAGGALCDYWRVPLPWMIGSLLATTVASLAGLPLVGPVRLRHGMVAVLGIMLGSAFQPDTLEHAERWAGTIVALLGFVVVIAIVLGVGLRRLAGFGPVTSYFAAVPGGFGEMVLLSAAFGGDERSVSLVHSIRIMVSVIAIPIWFRLFEGYQPTGTGVFGAVTDLDLGDGGILVASAVAGWWLARRLGVPAPSLIGPMIASGVVHLAGLTLAKPPGELVAAAQVVIGTAIGCRFSGVSIANVARALIAGTVTAMVMLAAAVGAAVGVSAWTGIAYPPLLLAFAPGGLAEMSLISLAMGIDTAFVSTHHLVRILFVVLAAPLMFRILRPCENHKAEFSPPH